MSDLGIINALLLAGEVALASLALPAAGWLLAATYRKSAAGRRLVWITVFAMLLALPLLVLALPSIAVIALPAPAPDPMPIAAIPPAAGIEVAPGPSGFGWPDLIPVAVAIWLAGLAKLGVQHLIAFLRLELMRRGAKPWDRPVPAPLGGCELLVSEDCPGPMTWGALRPVIMLPDEALDWPAERLTAVLRHEMAHVRRRDGLAQALAVIACALYWPNPLVWAAAKALRREAELAADDTVIASGVLPSDYAGQLLELAAEWRERRLTPTGLAMAAPPALSQRVQSILSTDAVRTGATAMDTFKLVLLGGAATAALTLARPSLAEVAAPAPAASPAPQAQVSAALRSDIDQGVAQAAAKAPSARPRASARNPASQSSIELAQQAVPAPPAVAAAPLPPLPAFPPAPPGALPIWVAGVRQSAQVPYNPATDDPASPAYIPPGQPGAGHPVPADLAKALNGRKNPAAPWTLQWLPAAPGALPPPGFRVGTNAMTPEQLAELNRKLAAIGPAVEKAIKDAHVDETVQKALSAEDAKTREEVARQLQQIGPLIQQAIANAHIQEAVGQRLAQVQPQLEAARKQARERQAQAEDRVAAQLEEQAKRARERAQRDREQLKDQAAPSPAPKN